MVRDENRLCSNCGNKIMFGAKSNHLTVRLMIKRAKIGKPQKQSHRAHLKSFIWLCRVDEYVFGCV